MAIRGKSFCINYLLILLELEKKDLRLMFENLLVYKTRRIMESSATEMDAIPEIIH